MKPDHWKQVKCKFNLYLVYEENDMMCIYDKDHMSALLIKITSQVVIHLFGMTIRIIRVDLHNCEDHFHLYSYCYLIIIIIIIIILLVYMYSISFTHLLVLL